MPESAADGQDPTETLPTFADLGLAEPLLRGLESLGHDAPTPVQAAAVPPLVAGRDVLAVAATGTGKTAAFSLPVLQRLADGGRHDDGTPVAVVLAPTRELATQVAAAVRSYGSRVGARVVTACGGQPLGPQVGALRQGCDVVVATPGRAVDLLEREVLDLSAVDVVVLDEADEMLDLGFADELEAVLAQTPEDRQTVLVSATLPRRTEGLARSHLRDPVRLDVAAPTAEPGEAPAVRHVAHVVPGHAKAAALARVLDVEAPTAALVFCRTRMDVERVTEALAGRGLHPEALHGGLAQESRDRVMSRVRAGTTRVLVATDVAARGLDVDLLTHVVNVDLPRSPELFTHRVGRVGRAGRDGVAVTLVTPNERGRLTSLQRVTGVQVPVEPVPDLAAARAVRAGRTRDEVAEVLDADLAPAATRPQDPDLAGLDEALDALVADGRDLRDVARAALLAAHRAAGRGSAGEQELPVPPPRRDDAPRGRRDDDARGPRRGAADRDGRGGGRTGDGREADRPERAGDSRPSAGARGRADGGRPAAGGPDRARLFVSAGRRAGMRPQDLVGAITGESSLSGRDIGAIDVADGFSLVEVPERAADAVVAALRQAKIRGRSVTVRRDRDGRPSVPGPGNGRPGRRPRAGASGRS